MRTHKKAKQGAKNLKHHSPFIPKPTMAKPFNQETEKPSAWAETRMWIAEQMISLALDLMPSRHPDYWIWGNCINDAATKINERLVRNR